MNEQRKTSTMNKLILFPVITLSAVVANASVIPVGPVAFPGTSTSITFTGLTSGTEVNGLTAGGVMFNYSLGNGAVIIDGGPGITNNINPPNVVSIGNPSGVLTLTLPSFVDTFGFGYAVLAPGVSVPNATTITLFNGATNVGTLSYNGVPDPIFAGGFAGIQSTIPFNRVAISFNSAVASAFALDNIRTASVLSPCGMPLCVTNFTLVSQQIAGGGKVYATYRADLVNTVGPPAPVLPPGTSDVTATLINLDPFKVRVVPGQDNLKFAAVLNNSSVTHSSNTFTVIIDPTVPFDPNQLQFSFQIGPAAPISNPGPNQTVRVGSVVTVNGSGSSNPSGTGGPLTYFWMFTSRPPGSSTRLFYEDTPTAMFIADAPGTYVLALTVRNGKSTSTSNITITAQ